MAEVLVRRGLRSLGLLMILLLAHRTSPVPFDGGIYSLLNILERKLARRLEIGLGSHLSIGWLRQFLGKRCWLHWLSRLCG